MASTIPFKAPANTTAANATIAKFDPANVKNVMKLKRLDKSE